MASRIKAFFIALLLLCICAVSIWWMYNGDRGYLAIEGDTPQKISGILLGNQQCQQTPCSLTVYPGTYDALFQKDGYYTIQKNIRINLFETTPLNLKFIPVPHLRLQGPLPIFSYPIRQASPSYTDNQDTVLLPFVSHLSHINDFSVGNETVDAISFSPTGSGAVIVTNKKTLLVRDNKDQSVVFPPSSSSFVWDTNNTVYFWSTPDPGLQDLWSIQEDNTLQKEGTFYNLSHGTIFPFPRKIIISSREANYWLDTTAGRKSVILPQVKIMGGKWDPEGKYFLYQAVDGTIHIFDGKTVIDLPSLPSNLDLIDFYSPDALLYSISEENKVKVFLYSLSTQTSKIILDEQQTGTTQKIEKVQDMLYLLHNHVLYTIEGVIL
jgi:hypothetical protein